jgi:wingless-type MMTV integration site family protein 4
VFGRVVRTRSRETAFIYAINSAAAMYEVTRACTKGDLKKCSCNKQPEKNESNNNNNFKISKTMTQNFEWSGCSDNVLFGYKLSKNFVDSKELLESDKQQLKLRRRDNSYTSKEIKLMNLHNNEVGRRIILKNMKQMCKCHGVSGSCSIKVCWKILPEFRVIGDELMKSYRLAARIKENRVKERVKKLNMIVSRRSSRNSHETELLYKDDLIFIDKSPNFCQHSKRDGIIGTKGRLCSLIEDETISNNTLLKSYSDEISKTCDYLCCGRGYYSKVIETEEDCDCQFQWCCSVKCKKCKKKVTQYYCK